MTRLKHLAPIFLLLLPGCASIGEYDKPTVDNAFEPRDVQQAFEKTRGATILDVDLFQPTTSVGECNIRDIPLAKKPMGAAMEKALQAAQKYSDSVDGAGLIVLVDGHKIYEKYREGVTKSSLTDSYSMQKSLLGLSYAVAVDKGIIGSLQDPSEKYIPEWKNDPRGQIPLQEFMQMSSGLEPIPFGSPESIALLFSADINAVALSMPIKDVAGKIFRYQNGSSQIAGIALQNAVQKAGYDGYQDFFAANIWCPVGNQDARLWLDRKGGSPHYYTGMFASLSDWARIGELIRLDGRVGQQQVISKKSLADILEPSATNPNYGMQVWLGTTWERKRRYSPESSVTVMHSAPYIADDVVFFDGFGGQRVYVVRSAKLTIVRTGFVNFSYDDAIIVNHILEALQIP